MRGLVGWAEMVYLWDRGRMQSGGEGEGEGRNDCGSWICLVVMRGL